MYRGYLVSSILALGLYGYAQLKGWSVMPSPAEEFQRMRQEQRNSGTSGRTGGWSGGRGSSGGGFSGK